MSWMHHYFPHPGFVIFDFFLTNCRNFWQKASRGNLLRRAASSCPSVFFVRITQDHYQFTPDMKKMLTLLLLISFAMISSCQKQDSTAEQQLAQRKVELDAREEALAERKSVLDEREKALDEREKVIANVRTIPTGVQGQPPQ